MSTNYLNLIAQKIPTFFPIPAPSKMSTIAKVAMGVATLFFTAFLYVAFSGSRSKPNRPQSQTQNELTPEQQKIERIRADLLSYCDKTVPSQYEDEFNQLFSVFTGSCSITPNDIADAKALIENLSTSYPAKPMEETVEERRAIVKKQDEEYNEALKVDQRKDEMSEALTTLEAELSEATKALDIRFNSLDLLRICWQRICTLNSSRSTQNDEYTKLFSDLEGRFIKGAELDLSVPKDCYKDKIEFFNNRFSDKGKFFEGKRAALAKSYGDYSEAIEKLQESLAWERLKAYHAEVKEEFFASQFSTELLTKIYNRDDLPRPE